MSENKTIREIKVYISAPVTGRPLEERKGFFATAAKNLRDMGFVPVNPMTNGVPPTAAHATHMKADLKLLLASAYYVQALDSVNSAGCYTEELMAEACDIKYIGAIHSDGSISLTSAGRKVQRNLMYRIQQNNKPEKEP